jgi:hypothetical protein
MRTTTGYLIAVDGTSREVEVPANMPAINRLQMMHAELGCTTVDMISLDDGLDVWVDDEGMYNSEPNLVGSIVVATIADQSGRHLNQSLFGNLLFLGRADSDAAGLDSTDLAMVRALAGRILSHSTEPRRS